MDNNNIYNERMSELENSIKEFKRLGVSQNSKCSLSELYECYGICENKAEAVYNINEIPGINKLSVEQVSKVDAILDDLVVTFEDVYYEAFDRFVEQSKQVEEKVDKQQGLQLAIFSMVITILSFVLNNSKVLSAENINFKNVLLVNLSFLLVSIVLFSLIYIFMGLKNQLNKGLKAFILIVLPLLLIISIILISILM